MKAPLLALSACLLWASAAPAQTLPDGSVVGFEASGDYSLTVGRKPVPGAEIYASPVPSILILSSAFSTPLLLTPRGGRVDRLNLMKVARQADGTVKLLPDAVLQAAGTFDHKNDGSVVFTVEGKTAALVPRPPLLGLKTGEDLRRSLPEYVRGAQRYTPDAAALADLRKQGAPATVRVYFGSWCPHCRQLVPSLLKVQERLAGSPRLRFEYYGIPQGLNDAEARKADVHSVPTGIVFVGGREVGRLVADGWRAPEVTLDQILNPKKKP